MQYLSPRAISFEWQPRRVLISFSFAFDTSSSSAQCSTNTHKLSITCTISRLTILPYESAYTFWQCPTHVSLSVRNLTKPVIQACRDVKHAIDPYTVSSLPLLSPFGSKPRWAWNRRSFISFLNSCSWFTVPFTPPLLSSLSFFCIFPC